MISIFIQQVNIIWKFYRYSLPVKSGVIGRLWSDEVIPRPQHLPPHSSSPLTAPTSIKSASISGKMPKSVSRKSGLAELRAVSTRLRNHAIDRC